MGYQANLYCTETTMWILARNDINLSMAASLIRTLCPASSDLVCNKGQRVSPYFPRQSLALFMEDSTNYCCQKQRHNVHSSSQISPKYVFLVGLLLPYLNSAILKAWSCALGAQRPSTTGIVRRQIPLLNGTTWRNNGTTAWNGFRFEHIFDFYVEITNIHVLCITIKICHESFTSDLNQLVLDRFGRSSSKM